MNKIKRNAEAITALEEYLQLREEIGDMEQAEENRCSCDSANFHRCDFCDEMDRSLARSRRLIDLWADSWAVMLNEDTLPFQAWCECGHISGQHGAAYPHKCAVDNGCEKECYGFRVKADETVCRVREAWLQRTVDFEHECVTLPFPIGEALDKILGVKAFGETDQEQARE